MNDPAPTRAMAWESLPIELAPHVLRELLDGGQAFRWNRDADGIWTGLWENHAVRLQGDDAGRLRWRPLTPGTRADDVCAYLAEDDDWDAHVDRLPWRSDPHLAAALRAFPGLRLLRQPLGETLLSFLCSSTKQIVQIKAMMELLARRFGSPLDCPLALHRLPTWAQLAEVPEAALRACKLGYRARYVAETARQLAGEPDWEARLSALPYPAAHAWLCSLPGVGPKVADCVLLFGNRRLEAFPVDTWILQTLAQAYHLKGWTNAQLATFGQVHFGPQAGLAQQFLFAASRAGRGAGFAS